MTQDAAITLRLFRRDDPFRPIECRELHQGELAIGRDPDAGWALEDPDRAISRRHCTLVLEDGRLTLRDTSTNGVYIGPERRRAPARAPVSILPGEAFRFGPYMIAVDRAQTIADDSRPATPARIVEPSSPKGAATTTPASSASPAVGSALDAFCAGAGLDPSSFLDEDPAQVMRRVGEVYRRMVRGLTELMSERTALKSDYDLDQTTVHATGNNPFRWTSAECVARDLLRQRADGFLSGASAVEGSFADLKIHLQCMLAGARGAVGAALERLRPGKVEAGLQRGSLRLKSRAAAAWQAYGAVHAQMRREAEVGGEGPISHGFRVAYLRELEALARTGERP